MAKYEYDINDKKTFNDLLDVVCKALKDNILDFFEAGSDGTQRYIMASYEGRDLLFYEESDDFYGHDHHIKYIESLYTETTETFVIEHQSDFPRIKLNDKKTKIKLANGELVRDEIWDILKNLSGKNQLSILKGATVTQKRLIINQLNACNLKK